MEHSSANLRRYRRFVTLRRVLLVIFVGAMLVLVSCSKAAEVGVRAEREAFCLKWRAVKEVGKRADDPRVVRSLSDAGKRLISAAPDEQRRQVERAIEAARDLASSADQGAGSSGDAATEAGKVQIEKALNQATAEVDKVCK